LTLEIEARCELFPIPIALQISSLLSGLRAAHLSDSVCVAVEGQLSGGWADGGIGSVDLSCVDNRAVVVGRGSGCESGKGDERDLHLDGCWWY
jgi:hypothetical protein